MRPKKILSQTKYRRGSAPIKGDSLPLFRHTPKKLVVVAAEIHSDGVAVREGIECDFQDIRVYFKPGVID